MGKCAGYSLASLLDCRTSRCLTPRLAARDVSRRTSSPGVVRTHQSPCRHAIPDGAIAEYNLTAKHAQPKLVSNRALIPDRTRMPVLDRRRGNRLRPPLPGDP